MTSEVLGSNKGAGLFLSAKDELRKKRFAGTLDGERGMGTMNIRYSFRRIEGTPALETYIERKFQKVMEVARRSRVDPLFQVSLKRISGHREGDVFEIAVNVRLQDKVLNNIEHAADVYAAVDKMEAELFRQLEKEKEKPVAERVRRARKEKNDLRPTNGQTA